MEKLFVYGINMQQICMIAVTLDCASAYRFISICKSRFIRKKQRFIRVILGFSPLWIGPRSGHFWESQVLLTDCQVVFPRGFAHLWWTIGSVSVKYSWKGCKHPSPPPHPPPPLKKKKKKKKKIGVITALELIHTRVLGFQKRTSSDARFDKGVWKRKKKC